MMLKKENTALRTLWYAGKATTLHGHSSIFFMFQGNILTRYARFQYFYHFYGKSEKGNLLDDLVNWLLLFKANWYCQKTLKPRNLPFLKTIWKITTCHTKDKYVSTRDSFQHASYCCDNHVDLTKPLQWDLPLEIEIEGQLFPALCP
jgi:hypothetical protein